MVNSRVKCLAILMILASSCLSSARGFTLNADGRKFRSSVQRSQRWFTPRKRIMTMYVPPNTPTSQTAPMVGQKILAAQTSQRPKQDARRSSTAPLSNSVLASCDTLPQFHTAHGILSPQTIQRLVEMIPSSERSVAVAHFIDSYRSEGPMSCLPMLADPDVLPHLTAAMRDIV